MKVLSGNSGIPDSGRRRRRTWSTDQKRQILAETLEPGASVMVRVRAKASEGEVRFFGDDASQMDNLLDDANIGLRIHVSARTADAEALKARLERARSGAIGKGGEISLVASLEGRQEVEVKLPGRYRLDGALRGALKSAPGVLMLEEA